MRYTQNVYLHWEVERAFMEKCYQAGWRFSDHSEEKHFPSVAGTYEWDKALLEAQNWWTNQDETKTENKN